MSNPFAKFQAETKKVKVKSLDNQEVTIRTLSIEEADRFAKMMIKDTSDDGKVSFDYTALADIRKEKVSVAMTEPKLSLKEINELSAQAAEAINEIADAIDEFNASGKGKN